MLLCMYVCLLTTPKRKNTIQIYHRIQNICKQNENRESMLNLNINMVGS